MESLPIIFYTSQATDEFGVTYVSKNMEAFTGYTPEEVTADTSFWADHIHPEDAPRALRRCRRFSAAAFMNMNTAGVVLTDHINGFWTFCDW